MKTPYQIATFILLLQNIFSNTPVFMNLPLDIQRYHQKGNDMSKIFAEMSALKVTGVTVDVWWSSVEVSPNQYDFSFYKDLLKLARSYDLQV